MNVSELKPPLSVSDPYTAGDPLDIHDGRVAAHKQALIQRDALAELEKRVEEAAQAEFEYRKALAIKIVELRPEWPATVCENMAKGDDDVAALRRSRDIARGHVMAQRERVRELEGERAMLRELLEFSRKSLGMAA